MYIVKRNNNDLFDTLFDSFFETPKVSNNSSMMRTDIKEEEDRYLLDIEIPGFNKEDIKLSVEEGYLTIEATRNEENVEEEKDNYIRRERYFGNCSRSFYVGNVSEDNIKANYNNGVLNVVIPKLTEAETKKYISID